MKRSVTVVLLVVAIVFVLALAGCAKPTAVTAPPPVETPPVTSIQPGDFVAATWTDGNFWHAKVLAVTGDNVEVQFVDDQSKLTVPVADVRAIEKKTWAVGDSVLAVWTVGRFYPGTITAVSGSTYTVKWDDGSSPTPVTADKIVDAK